MPSFSRVLRKPSVRLSSDRSGVRTGRRLSREKLRGAGFGAGVGLAVGLGFEDGADGGADVGWEPEGAGGHAGGVGPVAQAAGGDAFGQRVDGHDAGVLQARREHGLAPEPLLELPLRDGVGRVGELLPHELDRRPPCLLSALALTLSARSLSSAAAR